MWYLTILEAMLNVVSFVSVCMVFHVFFQYLISHMGIYQHFFSIISADARQIWATHAQVLIVQSSLQWFSDLEKGVDWLNSFLLCYCWNPVGDIYSSPDRRGRLGQRRSGVCTAWAREELCFYRLCSCRYWLNLVFGFSLEPYLTSLIINYGPVSMWFW